MDYDALTCHVSVRIMEEGRALGPGLVELLEGVQTYGSLQGAARSMHMSYTKAWTIVKHAEQIWGFPLTKRYVGGKTGGHSELTQEAIILLAKYRQLMDEIHAIADASFARLFSTAELQKLRNT